MIHKYQVTLGVILSSNMMHEVSGETNMLELFHLVQHNVIIIFFSPWAFSLPEHTAYILIKLLIYIFHLYLLSAFLLNTAVILYWLNHEFSNNICSLAKSVYKNGITSNNARFLSMYPNDAM